MPDDLILVELLHRLMAGEPSIWRQRVLRGACGETITRTATGSYRVFVSRAEIERRYGRISDAALCNVLGGAA